MQTNKEVAKYPEFKDFIEMVKNPENKNYIIGSLWNVFLRKIDEIRKKENKEFAT